MTDSKEPALHSQSFLTMMHANRAGIWTTLLAAALILVVWQRSFTTLGLAALLPETSVLARDEASTVLLYLLGSFAPALLVTVLWRHFVERQRLQTLLTAHMGFRWQLSASSALVVGCLGLGITLGFDAESTAHIKARFDRFSLGDWLVLSGAYMIGIGVQATFEEVFVRGWLSQHINRLIPSALIVIVVTSLAFAAMHFQHQGWATYVVAATFGLAFGWSAVRLNGLEAALGAHIANNLVGALLAGQMMTGNPPVIDAAQFIQLGVYVLGFLVFVEVWARFFEKPSLA